ncbi:non-ribosomal peptide synthetase [Nocardia sp. SYP-A9097]|uniref:non-ribosomal peptide synthetase n=1 Tax=Nocardia sp. SYP-A9097 TaxID=2663237 RepID=UPI001E4AABF6|nr:non-ribosomal peptide synthetase [Nocardia sp. SYP-A9097]
MLDKAGIRALVAAALDVAPESIGDDDDLVSLGMHSMKLMQLSAKWRKQGYEVRSSALALEPTLAAWTDLLLAGRVTTLESTASTSSGAGATADVASDSATHANPEAGRGESTAPGDEFGLATMQHAYWMGRRQDQALGGVAAHLYVEFDGNGLDPERLRRAVTRLVHRHEQLRARFTDSGTQQTLPEPRRPVFESLTLKADSEAAELERLRQTKSHQRMDVEAGQVIDIALSLLSGGGHRLHVDVDMLAGDAQSYRRILEDLATLYEADTDLTDSLGYTFRAYLAAKEQAAPDNSADRDWWADRLGDLPGIPALPVLPETERGDPSRSVRLHHWFDPAARRRLNQHAHSHGVTPAVTLATVFSEVIARWSAQQRFLLNVPLFNREPLHDDIDRVVGDFTNSVLVDVDATRRESMVDRTKRLQRELHTCAAHSVYEGLDVLRDLGRLHGAPVTPSVVFTSGLDLGELFSDRVLGVFGEPVWIISQGPQVDLDAQVVELNGGLLVNWDLRRDALPEGVDEAMFTEFRTLLDGLVADGADWHADLAIALPPAQRAVRETVNATDLELGGPRTLHEAFFALAHRHPDRPALRWHASDESPCHPGVTPPRHPGATAPHHSGATAPRHPGALLAGIHQNPQDDSWRGSRPKACRDDEGGPAAFALGFGSTYGELAGQALAVGRALADAGVRPGDTVAVMIAKGHRQIPAVLGVLAAGATYLPISTEQPQARRDRILERGGARVVLIDAPAELPAQVTSLLIADAFAGERLDAPHIAPTDSVAYVLFTSGSTGEPKGVEVSHRAAANTIDAIITHFDLGSDDHTIGLSALEFDLSVFDIFAPLSLGGAVVVVEASIERDAVAWSALIAETGVTVVNCAPGLITMLLDTATAEQLRTVRVVITGGDRVKSQQGHRFRELVPGVRFAGLGGTTETAIHSTVCEIADAYPLDRVNVPYGTPMANVRCRVVNSRDEDCPDWVPGELWIGGLSVADGYRGDPERTADRFVTVDGVRWYRTGDMARYLPDGTLDFLGRADHQVKIRGFRVELGEVESALAAQPGIREAVALVTDSGRLAAVAAAEGAISTDVVLAGVRDLLPAHMIPEILELVPAIPLTGNGKLDRAAIRRMVAADDDAARDAYLAPETALEAAVEYIAATVLGIEKLGVATDFFDIGGNSILATTLTAKLRGLLALDRFGVTAVLEGRTVRGICATLLAEETGADRLDQVARILLELAEIPNPEPVAAR